jgi:hypothetical protein
VFWEGTATGGFADNAVLFSDIAGANTYSSTPVVPPGAEKQTVQHGDRTAGASPMGGRQVPQDAADPRYSGVAAATKAMLFIQTLKVVAPANDIEFSFDGVYTQGKVDGGGTEFYRNRFEAGIAVRFVGTPSSGSITTIVGANLVDGEQFVLDDGVNTAVTFEFDNDSSVSETDTLRQIVIDGTETADQIRDLIINAVNSAPVLDITASSGGAATVSLVNDRNGTVGDQAITDTVVDAGFIVSGMTGGVGTDTAFRIEGW